MDLVEESARRAKPTNAAIQERILDAARVCFERYGFNKTTIEDIAKEAGVSRPTVYKYCSGKDEIVNQISLAEMEMVTVELRRRLKRHNSFADIVTEAILISVQVAHENPYVRRFVQELEQSRTTHQPTSPFQIGARQRWHSLLTRAQATGELANDINMDQVVSWLSLSQMVLVVTGDQLGIDEDQMRHFIRRFMVEPLLAARGQPGA